MQLIANVTMRTQTCVNHLITFSSSNEEIATIDRETGLVHAVAPGTVTFTAISRNNYSDNVTIRVEFNLDGLQILYLPSDLLEIGDEAFSGLSCQAVIIPEGCTTIGENAFTGCTELLYVKIPSTVENYPASAFDGCPKVTIDWTK